MKRFAFTLSEVLLVLSVIGVVAALTIPTLIQKISDDQYKAAWKKQFSTMSQAAMILAADNGGSLSGIFTSAGEYRNKFANYMSFIQMCDPPLATGPNGCWHSASGYSFMDGNAGTNLSSYYRGVLNNGTLMIFSSAGSACSDTSVPSADGCGWILFDVNGYKSPNKVGKDIFGLEILRNGVAKPLGSSGDSWDVAGHSCSSSGTGYACSAQILYQ